MKVSIHAIAPAIILAALVGGPFLIKAYLMYISWLFEEACPFTTLWPSWPFTW